ncbi:MAG: homogentisate 1,2-dioxygenase [Zavarzinella sp.]
MPYYQQLGTIPAKRHIQFPNPGGGFLQEGIYYEEVVTTEGFHRAYSIVYHLRPPTRVLKMEAAAPYSAEVLAPQELRHIHLKTAPMPRGGDVISGRVPMFCNSDVTLTRCRPDSQQQMLFRNATHEELWFIHHGSGVLKTMFGEQPVRQLDYVLIPRSTTYQFVWDNPNEADLLLIESRPTIRFPNRYLNPDGQFQLGAPFSERDLQGPKSLVPVDDESPTEVMIQDSGRRTIYTLASHPFDVVGWDGCHYPFTFNALDFEPITGKIHQPPPIHQTFQTDAFVVCTFAPRQLDYHPQAIKVPYAHSNVESDEVLYYVLGQFGSRKGVEQGSFTMHPRGIAHGPHPGTIMGSRDATSTNELAVMVDTFAALLPTKQAWVYDDPQYPYSWL